MTTATGGMVRRARPHGHSHGHGHGTARAAARPRAQDPARQPPRQPARQKARHGHGSGLATGTVARPRGHGNGGMAATHADRFEWGTSLPPHHIHSLHVRTIPCSHLRMKHSTSVPYPLDRGDNCSQCVSQWASYLFICSLMPQFEILRFSEANPY